MQNVFHEAKVSPLATALISNTRNQEPETLLQAGHCEGAPRTAQPSGRELCWNKQGQDNCHTYI